MITSTAGQEPAFSNHEIVIEAGKTELHYWRDLWRYRELFYFLAWRDILVRYKQTVIGIAWALIQPLFTTAVLTIVFGVLGKFKNGLPYPYVILVFAAQLPWQFFSRALSEAGNSLISNSNLISKIYFPRLIIPASAVITALIDFLIAAAFLPLILVWFRWMPDWRVVMVLPYLLLALALAMGAGLWIAALNVAYRDFRYIVPIGIQMGTYVSPVGFPSDIVPHAWRLLYSLNPIVGVIDGFRWAILRGQTTLYMPAQILSVIVTAAILVTGIIYFRATEKRFADVI